MTTNILLAGVGGQGLVLSTKLICDAAHLAGLDAKSNDVVGLSQRGGKIWGSVRIGGRVHSPNVPPGEADYLLALEPLEGLRWSYMLRDGAVVLLNRAIIPPVPVIHEKAAYPDNIEAQLLERLTVLAMDANAEGRKLGNPKVANTFLLGALAAQLDIGYSFWEESIRRNVSPAFVELNLKALDIGHRMVR